MRYKKIAYISSTTIPSTTAQSHQILEMCKALNEYSKLTLISPVNLNNKNCFKVFSWKKIKLKFNFLYFRYCELFLKSYIELKNNSYDLIFTRNIIIVFLIFFFKRPVIYEMHQKPNLISLLMLFVLKNNKHFYVVVISKALSIFLSNSILLKKLKVSVMHDGVDIQKYKRLEKFDRKTIRKKLNLNQTDKIILYTGSFYKGLKKEHINFLLENSKDITICLVGANNQEYKSYNKEYIGNSRVVILKKVPHYKSILYQKSSDFLILPNDKSTNIWWCTSPLKMFEYMATKNLIVSTNIGSIAEILNEKNSMEFNLYDSSSLLKIINMDLKKTRDIALNAFQNVEENYTWKIRAKKVLNIPNQHYS